MTAGRERRAVGAEALEARSSGRATGAEVAPSGGFADVLMASVHRRSADPLGAGFVPHRNVTVHTLMGPIDLTRSPHALLRPLEGRIESGFWADRQRLNRERLLLDGEHWLEEAGNFENLRAAAGRSDAEFRGMVFMDSDVHKWLEALGWELGREPSEDLARRADAAIELVEAAQEDSGYLNSYYQVARPGPRFTNLASDHELYCAGHLTQRATSPAPLTQAATAHARGRGDERLIGVARRFADHIGGVFRDRDGTPGHPEIE